MTDPLTDPNDALDAILHTVRKAQPSTVLGSRILRALDEVPQQRRWWKTPRFAIAAAAAASVFAILAAYVLHPTKIVPSVAVAAPTNSPRIASPSSVKPIPAGTASRTIHSPWIATGTRVATGSQQARLASAVEAGGIVDVPPPERPLTEEELLLIQLVRHTQPSQIATLTSDEIRRWMKSNAQEYELFFPPERVAPATAPEN